MRTHVLTGPAPWAVNRLGTAAAAQLWMQIPAAMAAAVARVMNAPGASRTARESTFADERWTAPYEELSARLRTLDGASVARPPRAAHPVVLLREQVLLPWCYGASGAFSMRDARPGRSFGRLARELFTGRSAPRTGEAAGRPGPVPAVLVAGYACSPDHGLLRVCLGQARVADDEALHWEHVEDLPLPPPTIPRPRLQRFP